VDISVRHLIDDLNWIDAQPVSGSSYSLLLLTDGLEPGTRLAAYTPLGVVAGRGVVGSDGKCGMALWGDESPSPKCNSGFFSEGDDFVIYVVSHDRSQTGVSDQLSNNQTGLSGLLNLEWLDGTPGWTVDGWGVARLVA